MSLVQSLIAKGAFGLKFPDTCPDGYGTIGTDDGVLSLAIQAEIPGIEWPLRLNKRLQNGFLSEDGPNTPDTLVILDFVEFCYRAVAQPIEGSFHSFFNHSHLSFDEEAGKASFQSDINRIFSRNSLAYELNERGQINRLAPPVLQNALVAAVFNSGDPTLDSMLEDSRLKFMSSDPVVRREAVERLWDCWERLKSQADTNKKVSIQIILSQAANDPLLKDVLEAEARALTEIGNTFHIRHSEVSQTAATDPAHLDYLSHRLFALIFLLLEKRR